MYSKPEIINGHRVTALLDTGSSSCFLNESVARHLGLNILSGNKNLFSFSDQLNPVTQSLGMIIVDEIEEALANNVYVFIVPDSTQPIDLLVGRPFLDLPHIAYTRIGEEFRIGYVEEGNEK
ncbi:CCHC-type domain-containing protein [Nephila pilipes]|uniref:CCHC-type domain-containing protein n=1 Tax=Nephila pilipes TaxID=299642 RepID=A0A8X6QGD9_NEPPI|nr:CCHC-type domain-containing protein [Nephila pilipes]